MLSTTNTQTPADTPFKHSSDIWRVTILNALVNLLLALAKIIIGFFAFSQALIADGIHSFSDLITDALVFFAAKMGGQLPDKEHPYGHARIETAASIIISILLIAVGLGLMINAIHSILQHTSSKPPTAAAIIVAVISIAANEGLFRYTLGISKKIHSNLLRNNAWHSRSDALVSVIVLFSVFGSMLGITYLDAIGAIVIALIILKMGAKMIWHSIKELIDTGVDEKDQEQIMRCISSVDGVESIHQLRTRSHGGNIFADVHIQVAPNISVSEGHYISKQVQLLLIKDIKYICDVTVHIDPEDDELDISGKDLPSRKVLIQLLKQQWHDLAGYQHSQQTVLHYLDGQVYIDLYLPVFINQQISQALIKTQYQQAVNDIPYIGGIDIYYY